MKRKARMALKTIKYTFDLDIHHQSFIESADFKKKVNGISARLGRNLLLIKSHT